MTYHYRTVRLAEVTAIRTDGSSYIKDVQRKVGAAIVDENGRVVWAEDLPPGTSTQKAELIAVTQALERAKRKKITIYTDSQYAFSTVHIQGPIYKDGGSLRQREKRLRTFLKYADSWQQSTCPGRYP